MIRGFAKNVKRIVVNVRMRKRVSDARMIND